jgi:hypothetical protein
MTVTWPSRRVLAGSAGTATVTLAYAAERRVRRGFSGPLDYDDGLVPGEIVATVMHLPHVTQRDERDSGCAALELRLRVRHAPWGPARLVREPWASAAFGGTLMTATLTLFLLGRTPPPWHWRADVLATNFGTHVACVAAVATVDDHIRRRTGV